MFLRAISLLQRHGNFNKVSHKHHSSFFGLSLDLIQSRRRSIITSCRFQSPNNQLLQLLPSGNNPDSKSGYFHLWIMAAPILLYQALSSSDCDDGSLLNSQRKEKVASVLAALSKSLRLDQIETDDSERRNRGKPWNSYHKSSQYPDIIVYPESTEDVSKIVKVCNDFHFPIVPFGGGTSIEGHTLALQGGLSLDMNRMKAILALNEKDLDIHLQAGVGYIELNEMLRDKGLWFPLDPGPGASVGGMCACRCSGSTAVRYGSMRENVLNVTAVMTDGTIIKTGSRARKSSAGYDLTRLLIGSEGTLAVITEATLKLHPIPKYSSALRISFPRSEGVTAASETAIESIVSGISVGRCELLDVEMIKCINKANPTMVPWPEYDTLLYEITGPSVPATSEQLDIVTGIAKKHGGSDVQFLTSTDPHECKRIWQVRKESLWSAMAVHPDRDPLITDVCVPLSKLPLIISQTRTELSKSILPTQLLAHAGDGNFHVLIFFKPDDPTEAKEAKRLSSLMAEQAIAMGGTCTGEHGVGNGKMDHLRVEMGPGAMSLMEKIKVMMDPNNIMNPGKVLNVGSESITAPASSSSLPSCLSCHKEGEK